MSYNLFKKDFDFIFCFSDAGSRIYRRRWANARKNIMRDAKTNRGLNDETVDRSRVDAFVKNSLKIDQKKSSWMVIEVIIKKNQIAC